MQVLGTVSAAGLEPATHALKASLNHNNKQLARPAYSMYDAAKPMRCQQDIGLGAQRVPKN
jgi:hypothetical protein